MSREKDIYVRQLEDYARYLMGKLHSDEWNAFAQEGSICVLRLAGVKSSGSGSYRVRFPDDPSKVETLPAPPEPDEPEKKA